MAFPNHLYYIDITIESDEIDADLTNYVARVQGDQLPAGVFTNAKADGSDLRFALADDTEIPIEVFSWDQGGEDGELYTRIPGTLPAASDTTIRLYYGYADAEAYAPTDPLGRNAVWQDYGFVDHGGGVDATGNFTTNAEGGVTPGGAVGQEGIGTNFDGSNDVVRIVDSDEGPLDFEGGPFTVQAYIAPNDTSSVGTVFCKQYGDSVQYQFFVTGAAERMCINTISGADVTGPATTGTAYKICHWVIGADGTCTYYLDAVAGNTVGPFTFTHQDGVDAVYGARFDNAGTSTGFPWDGRIDELRARSGALSAAWIAAELSNFTTPATFFTAGAQQDNPGFGPGGGGGSASRLKIGISIGI